MPRAPRMLMLYVAVLSGLFIIYKLTQQNDNSTKISQAYRDETGRLYQDIEHLGEYKGKPKDNTEHFKADLEKTKDNIYNFKEHVGNSQTIKDEFKENTMKFKDNSSILQLNEQCLKLYRGYLSNDRLNTKNNIGDNQYPYCQEYDELKGSLEHMSQNKVFQGYKKDFEEVVRTQRYADIEGNIDGVQPQVEYYYQLARQPWVKTICEIGFNLGNSALVWLASNTKTKLISFDINTHDYTAGMASFFRQRFGKRFNITFGDSLVTVPKFIQKNKVENLCDVIVIDGGHDYYFAHADLLNMKALANKNKHILILDDYPSCMGHFMRSLGRAWNELIISGYVEEIYGCFLWPDMDRGFTIGRFKF